MRVETSALLSDIGVVVYVRRVEVDLKAVVALIGILSQVGAFTEDDRRNGLQVPIATAAVGNAGCRLIQVAEFQLRQPLASLQHRLPFGRVARPGCADAVLDVTREAAQADLGQPTL